MDNDDLKQWVKNNLPSDSDIELIVLKGHLLIEECLNSIIDAAKLNNSCLGNLDLNFYKRVILVNTLCWKSPEDKIWNFILQINKLRNDLAHNLDSKKRERLILDVIHMHIDILDSDLIEETKAMSIKRQIELSFYLIIGYLDAMKVDIKDQYDAFYLLVKGNNYNG